MTAFKKWDFVAAARLETKFSAGEVLGTVEGDSRRNTEDYGFATRLAVG